MSITWDELGTIYTLTGTFTLDNSWCNIGIGGACPVVGIEGMMPDLITMYYSAFGNVGPILDSDGNKVAYNKLSSATGETTANIQKFFEVDNRKSICLSRIHAQDVFAEKDILTYPTAQLARPSYPFDSHGRHHVSDPYVIPDSGGSITRDKTTADGLNVRNFCVAVWVIVNSKTSSSGRKKIIQKGINWAIEIQESNATVYFTYLDPNGTSHTLGPLPLNATKGILQHEQMIYQDGDHPPRWTTNDKYLGRPTLIIASPSFLAVSTHDYDYGNTGTEQTRHNFIMDLFTNPDPTLLGKIMSLPMEPLTICNGWKGNDDDRFRSGSVLSAQIATINNVLMPSPDDSSWGVVIDDPTESRGYSLMQKMINEGPVMSKTDGTRWLINANNTYGNDIILDSSRNIHAVYSSPYNVKLYGNTTIKQYTIDALGREEKIELHETADATNVNGYGHAYIDLRILDGVRPAWIGHLLETINGEIVTDDEETTESLSIILRTRSGATEESLVAYGYEDLGVAPNQGSFNNGDADFVIHRLYLTSAPTNTYTVADVSNGGNLGHDPYIFVYDPANPLVKTYKGISCAYSFAQENADSNYYSFAYTLIPDYTHTSKMVYIGRTDDDGDYYYSLLKLNQKDSPRQKPIYRKKNVMLSAPIIFRFQNDLYVVFGEADPDNGLQLSSSARIKVLYKRINDFDWTPLTIPLILPSNNYGWDDTSVLPGGIYWHDVARQIIMTYTGYGHDEDTGAVNWRFGKVNINNLLTNVSDPNRTIDPITSDTVSVPPIFRGISPMFKLSDNNYYAIYTSYDTDNSMYNMTYGRITYVNENEVFPDEEFGEYDEFYEDSEITNKIRGLHKYYKRNGHHDILAVVGQLLYKGKDYVDSDGKLKIKFNRVEYQTDIESTQFSGTKNNVFFETFRDWCYVACKDNALTKYGGGLLKNVGITAPTISPTLNLVAGGLLGIGDHQYVITYYTSTGESNPTETSAISTTTATNRGINVDWSATFADIAPGVDVIGVKIYILAPDSASYLHVRTIDNTTTTNWTDDGTVTTRTNETGIEVTSDNDPPVQMAGVVSHDGVLFGWTDNRLYWSKEGNGDYWPTGNVIDVDTNGESIVTCKSIGHTLAIFTTTQIHVSTSQGKDESGNLLINVRKSRSPVGTVAARSVSVGPYKGTNAAYYLAGDRHIWIFNGEDSFRASDNIQKTVERISKNYIYNASSAYWDNNYILCAPFKSNINNSLITIDTRTGGIAYHPNQHISCFFNLASERDGYILIGGDSRSGRVYQIMDPDSYTDNGEAIVSRMQTKYFDLGMPESFKRIRKVFYGLRGPEGQALITVSVEDNRFSHSHAVPVAQYIYYLTTASNILNAFINPLFNDRFHIFSRSYTDEISSTSSYDISSSMQSNGQEAVVAIDLDPDRYVPMSSSMVGRNFSIKIESQNTTKEFVIDNISFAWRLERQL